MQNPNLRSRFLLLILVISFSLNIWGISWGAPSKWNPDEGTFIALKMYKNHSLNPHHFVYGSLFFYQLMASITPVLIINKYFNIFNSKNDKKAYALISSRIFTALLGTLIVLITFLITCSLVDEFAAILSSLLLALSMGFVNISHFATSDIPSIFWHIISCLMSVFILKKSSAKYYILGGMFAGLATAVKYNAIVAIIPLIIAHFLNQNKKLRNLVFCLFTMIVTFIIVNPVIFLSFCEFTQALLDEQLFNLFRRIDHPKAFLGLIIELKRSLGLPLFILSISGFIYSVKTLFIKSQRNRTVLIWSMFIPYYLFMGNAHVSNLRYTVFLIPFLMILNGKFLRDVYICRNKIAGFAFYIILCVVICYSFLFTFCALLQFSNDSRFQALNWVNNNVPKNSTIGIDRYGKNISAQDYKVVELPHNSKLEDNIRYMTNNALYKNLNGLLSEVHEFAASIGLCDVKQSYYASWYKGSYEKYTKNAEQLHDEIRTGKYIAPDYLVVTERFLRMTDDLLSYSNKNLIYISYLKHNYKLRKVFQYKFLPIVNAKPEFVNPKVYIYELEF